MQSFDSAHFKVHFLHQWNAASAGVEHSQSSTLSRSNYPEMENKKEEENCILLKSPEEFRLAELCYFNWNVARTPGLMLAQNATWLQVLS